MTAWAALSRDDSAVLPAALWVTAAGLILAVIDLDTLRLPDRVLGPAVLGELALLTGATTMTGQWGALGRGVLAAAALMSIHYVFGILITASSGLGDVKLLALTAPLTGWVSWPAVWNGYMAAWVLGGLAAAVALVRRSRAGEPGSARHAPIAFGPSILAGALVAFAHG
ncbi:hypothetical protein VV01_21850 [Luteipulveratus halotolerans]|uniref:Prepilin type IV endopeptidase peptidase domain-containing protein n=1 Tax=Luteipulveratus halotolerans TaxID=1631356 RepID=A0A0L6CEH5_9MICO|nr:hypothetical protein VV01_21850 [Luteipulveratus halotolerans]